MGLNHTSTVSELLTFKSESDFTARWEAIGNAADRVKHHLSFRHPEYPYRNLGQVEALDVFKPFVISDDDFDDVKQDQRYEFGLDY